MLLNEFPKRKGRKPKAYHEAMKKLQQMDNSNNYVIDASINFVNKNDVIINTNNADKNEPKVAKRRGRKPKGGKIVEVKNILVNNIPIPNIILHLNCKLNDIDYTPDGIKYEPNINNIDNYDFDNNNNLKYNFINNDSVSDDIIDDIIDNNTKQNTMNDTNDTLKYNKKDDYNDSNIYKKSISKKLKELSFNLKHNNINNKSSCFWCTYPFDNEPIYIPKYQLNEKYFCYGCFCSPECACSHLMQESIDSSSKFERYYLLNNIYGKIYDYDKNIKPAPNPYYLLNKFYGNLDIQEYRKLLENERLLLVVDKPLSQILPEVYEENEDFLISAKIVSKSNIKNKK